MQLQLQWRRESSPRGVDPIVGAKLTQVTSSTEISHDIYCEQRYCSTDGRRIAFLRTIGDMEALWIADLVSGETAPVESQLAGYPASDLHSDWIYFIRRIGSARSLIRFNLSTLSREELCDVSDCPDWKWVYPTISPDERGLVMNYRVDAENFGLYRFDLPGGEGRSIHVQKDMLNPHVQFDPGGGEDLLVQLNRGGSVDATGDLIRLVGDEGATLYVLDRDGGNRRDLPVGKPFTAPISGHQCWIGRSAKVIVACIDHTLHLLTPGESTSRCIRSNWQRLGHISVSSDGKTFVADDFSNGRLYVGSIATGYAVEVCDSLTSCGEPQHTHAHAYLLPDGRRIIFNSDRSGTSQVWMAELPETVVHLLAKG